MADAQDDNAASDATEAQIQAEKDNLNNSGLMLDNGDSPLTDLTGAKTEGAKDEDTGKDDKADGAAEDDSTKSDDKKSDDSKDGDDAGDGGDADDADTGKSKSDKSGDAGQTGADKGTAPAAQAESAAELEDPGEFKPKDRSFKVEYKDGDETKELLIEKPEDIQKLPKEADFGTAANFVKFQSDYTRMVQGLESDKSAHEDAKTKFDEQATANKSREDQLNNWEAELNFLRTQGKLPKLTKEQLNSNWRDPESLKNPDIKAHVDLLDYMIAENKKLTEAGLPPMGFREAHTQRENERIQEAIANRKKKSEDARKNAGGKVGGATNNSVPVQTNPDMIVGSGGSIYGG